MLLPLLRLPAARRPRAVFDLVQISFERRFRVESPLFKGRCDFSLRGLLRRSSSGNLICIRGVARTLLLAPRASLQVLRPNLRPELRPIYTYGNTSKNPKPYADQGGSLVQDLAGCTNDQRIADVEMSRRSRMKAAASHRHARAQMARAEVGRPHHRGWSVVRIVATLLTYW